MKTVFQQLASAVVKGFKGSGTAQDPLLIQTVEDLMDLSRQDVGLKSYYFRQTADIDCSTISSWPETPFNGHYDGGGYTIKKGTWNNLFSIIQAQSSITNLRLDGLQLAGSVEASYITHCFSTGTLISRKAVKCIIKSCVLEGYLIYGTAIDCTITVCISSAPLIRETATNCFITDCLTVINLKGSERENRGGIAQALTQGCIVERCFVTGRCGFEGYKVIVSNFCFSGIASVCDDSTIRHCALGRFDKVSNPFYVSIYRLVQKINNTAKLENNASIDSNQGVDYINGDNVQTVAAARFKQRFFEHTFHWDFDNVWQWDDKEDRPALRPAGIDADAASQSIKTAAQNVKTVDLLTQQISANIWL